MEMFLSASLWILCFGQVPGENPVVRPAEAQSTPAFTLLENRGQWSEELLFGGEFAGAAVGLRRDGIVLEVGGSEGEIGELVRLVFEGASEVVGAKGLEPMPGLHHWYRGNDPERWVRSVRGFARTRLVGLYEGIDLVLHAERGRLEYDLVLEPGTALEGVVVRCEGVQSIEVDGDGSLVLGHPLGIIRQLPPRCWEETADGERELAVRYRELGRDRFGFEVDGRDPALRLILDPELTWSTYWGARSVQVGGSVGDEALDVALDADGNVTVVGQAEVFGLFVTPGAVQMNGHGDEAFVVRFRQSDGELLYAARIGGLAHEQANAVAVDSLGRAVVAGWTQSFNFPVTAGAIDTTKQALSTVGFLLRLSRLGDDLDYSTYLEGLQGGGAQASSVAVAIGGEMIVAGIGAPDFPTTPGVYQPQHSGGGGADLFITRLSSSGTAIEWSTFFGGMEGSDEDPRIVLDAQENVTVAGHTGSLSFPTTPGAFQTSVAFNSMGEAFVSRLSSDGSQLLMSTYLTGSRPEVASAVAIAPNGDVVVGGVTYSSNFPTTFGAFQTTHSVDPPSSSATADGFVARLNSTGSQLLYSTFLGGGAEFVQDIAVDSSGLVRVAGRSGSIFFPVTPGAFDSNTSLNKNFDAFLALLDPTLSRLYYSTRLGSTQADTGNAIAVSPAGLVTTAGCSFGRDFPTTPNGAIPNYIGGQTDAFITTFELNLQGVQPFGSSRPSCLGPLVANATEMPVEGSTSFGLYCSQAPPAAQGFLVVQPTSGPGEPIAGALGWLRAIRSDAAGFVEVFLGNIPLVKGAQLACRFVFFNLPSCPGSGPLSWSNGLLIRVQ